MGNWFTKLFGAKECCCHHGEKCCQEKEAADSVQSTAPENAPVSTEQAPIEQVEVQGSAEEKTE